MKKIIVGLVLAGTFVVAHADADMNRQSYCASYGAMFMTIAAWRDTGATPERTLSLLSGVKGVPQQVKKDSVDVMYQDKTLANARGTKLGEVRRKECLDAKWDW
tara:strand:+ start:97684 stop:97995 length:312 start_codon:yes stop_codon:yes gene_type:complete